jgi:hypothetical protein
VEHLQVGAVWRLLNSDQALSASTIALKVALGRMMALTFFMSGWY